MEEEKFCMLCLATKVRMFDLDTTADLCQLYKDIVSLNEDLGLTKYIACYECFRLLQRYLNFKHKCRRSKHVLANILVREGMITLKSVEDVDRDASKLSSPLGVSKKFELSLDVSVKFTENEQIQKNNEQRKHLNSDDEVGQNDVKNIILIKSEIHSESEENTIKIEIDNPLSENNEQTKHLNSYDEVGHYDVKIIKSEIHSDSEENTINDNEPEIEICVKRKIKIKKTNDTFEGYTTVADLSPEEAIKEVILRKESDNYKASKYKCDLCYRGYGVQTTFDNHMKKHSPESGDYECNACHARFMKKYLLQKHYSGCHKKKFLCKICPYVCFCLFQAKQHMNTHKGKKYFCKMCNKEFKSPRVLVRHQQTKHVKEALRYICKFCGGTFTSERGLEVHSAHHKLDSTELLGPYCEVCDIQFASELAWKRHLVLSSKHEVSNGCEKCGETFSDAESLKSHHKEFHPEKLEYFQQQRMSRYTCVACNKVMRRRAYIHHMSTKHPDSDLAKLVRNRKKKKPCVCETCGKAFQDNHALKYHRRTHSDERSYKCEDCDKTYKYKSLLNCHRRDVHLRKQMLKCEHCPSEFQYHNSLMKHLKAVHLGVKPYKCSMCDRAFLNPSEVKVHMKHTHLNVPWPKKSSTGVKRERKPRTCL